MGMRVLIGSPSSVDRGTNSLRLSSQNRSDPASTSSRGGAVWEADVGRTEAHVPSCVKEEVRKYPNHKLLGKKKLNRIWSSKNKKAEILFT
jgi:hypothetical protein